MVARSSRVLKYQSSLLGAVIIVLASVASLDAKGPRLVLISGPLLTRPILIEDWMDTSRLTAGINERADQEPKALADRPVYELALFCGMKWVTYVDDGRPLTTLTADQANQHARFYPAVGAAPAVVVFQDEPGEFGETARRMGLIRAVDQMALDTFAKYGLRVRVRG